MALSINWLTRVISVPQADLTALGGGQYGLDVEWFRNALKDIEDSEQGMAHPPTHRRNAPVLLSGVTYAQTFEMINGYTVTFETVGSPYVVVASGGNHNLGDVTNFDGGMSLIVGNAAGLVETAVSGLTVDESNALLLIQKLLRNKQITNPVNGKMTVYDDDGTTVLVEGDLFEDAAGTTPYQGQGAERRERLA